jgi:hypothetical protein
LSSNIITSCDKVASGLGATNLLLLPHPVMPLVPVNVLEKKLLQTSTFAKISTFSKNHQPLKKISTFAKISNFEKKINFAKYPKFSKKDGVFYNFKCLRNIYVFYHKLNQSNSIFFTTYHNSLPALLPFFFTLSHLSCFLYFSSSRIWSTKYLGFF